jgi:hypothetical protein
MMHAMTRPASRTHRWPAVARRILPPLLALAVVAMVGWVALGPDVDPTAKALAKHVARKACGGPDGFLGGSTVIEEDAIPAIAEPAARLAAGSADRVSYIACEDGFADAGTFLLGFATPADLDAALASVAQAEPAGRLCLLDSELFTPGFGSGDAFATTCDALGGIELGADPGGVPRTASID